MTAISNNDIAKAIYLSIKDNTETEESVLFKKIIKFLSHRRLLNKSETILTQLSKIINKDQDVIEVKVMSAVSLTEKIKKELSQTLKDKYKAKGIVFIEKVDEKMLGGIRLEINDEVLDLTLKNRVNKLQEYLIKNYE